MTEDVSETNVTGPVLGIGVLLGTAEFNIGKILLALADFVSRSTKMRYQLLELDAKILLQWGPGLPATTGLSEAVDFFLFPIELGTLQNVNLELLELSSVFEFSDTYIISGVPKSDVKGGFGDMFGDNRMLLSFMACHLVMTFFFACTKMVPLVTREVNLKVAFIKSAWETMLPFFQEPMSGIPRRTSVRLACCVWLMGVTFFATFFSSTLKADFSSSKYLRIDTLDDLDLYPERQPVIIKGSYEDAYFRNRMKEDPKIKKLLNRVDSRKEGLLEPIDMFNMEFYEEIDSGRNVLIFNYYLFKLIADNVPELKEKERKLRLYVGKRAIKSSVLTFLFNRTLSRDLVENINLRILNMFESQPLQNIYNECDKTLQKHIWEKPGQEVHALIVEEAAGSFIILTMGLAMASIVFVLEVFIGIFQLTSRMTKRTTKLERKTRKRIETVLKH